MIDTSLFQKEFSGGILPDEPMKMHTTFKVGGKADLMLIPGNRDELIKAIQICREKAYPFFIIGKGSNLLVKDSGYNGVIIKVSNNISGINVSGNKITAEAGISLAALANAALAQGLSGLEFASGIPGTLGGGVYMNAGAYGGEMGMVIESVEAVHYEAGIKRFSKAAMQFDYRQSILQEADYVVLTATVALEKGNKEAIKEKMDDFNGRRREKQPVELPSAGSTFKRPEGYFAGKLIMDSGLRGHRIGGAQVSEKHCGFIVNSGGATASDILNLIAHVQEVVFSQFGVALEPEVRVLG